MWNNVRSFDRRATREKRHGLSFDLSVVPIFYTISVTSPIFRVRILCFFVRNRITLMKAESSLSKERVFRWNSYVTIITLIPLMRCHTKSVNDSAMTVISFFFYMNMYRDVLGDFHTYLLCICSSVNRNEFDRTFY